MNIELSSQARADAIASIQQYFERNMPELYKSALALNPTGRMAAPEEIARGVVFLASPAASFITGTNLVIDGALTKRVA